MIVLEQERQSVGGIESQGADYEMSFTPLAEKDGSSQ